MALVPIKPFTASDGRPGLENEPGGSQKALDDLARRALLIDIEGRKNRYYVLPPPMAGFFEFSMMRLRGDIDQKLLAELYLPVHQRRGGFHQGPVHAGRDPARPRLRQRARPLERERPPRPGLRAGERGHQDGLPPRHRPLLLPAQDGARGPRLRRPAGHLHDLQHDGGLAHPARLRPGRRRGRRAGPARRGPGPEPRPVRRERQEQGLFICNCCGCCCEAMIAARRFGILHPVHTTNFLPVVDRETCTGCGECVGRLPRRGHDPGLGQRPAPSQEEEGASSTKTSASAAASASGSARRGASASTPGPSGSSRRSIRSTRPS